ncbi:serine protease 27-like [Dicentrarchus labrax]|uniref:serine protease 27-like n=1 Tax=Dicentrarchus labrax TaxID=13489 RepID=UPI0021F50CD3|nr:serine protease 27-like [Dicentrarchus labrax]
MSTALLLDPEILQQLKVPIIPQIVCKVRYPKLTADMMCAGNMAGEKDTCKCFVLPKRDYGGPLVCRAGSGFVQAGVMSYGSLNGCTFPGSPGIFTQVSKHLRFINDYIHRR